MFSSATLVVVIDSIAAARPQTYIPTAMPSNITGDINPAMFLKVFDSVQDNPCSNQTATRYPSFDEIQGKAGSCVNANTINTDQVTYVSRFNDEGRIDFNEFDCPLLGYNSSGRVGDAQTVSYSLANRSWIALNQGYTSFKFACVFTQKVAEAMSG